jgi:hypothetical protein
MRRGCQANHCPGVAMLAGRLQTGRVRGRFVDYRLRKPPESQPALSSGVGLASYRQQKRATETQRWLPWPYDAATRIRSRGICPAVDRIGC